MKGAPRFETKNKKIITELIQTNTNEAVVLAGRVNIRPNWRKKFYMGCFRIKSCENYVIETRQMPSAKRVDVAHTGEGLKAENGEKNTGQSPRSPR